MTSALFVAGAGGTGKTTVAGALAVAASRTGRQTLVLTVDPALRLGQALGVSHLGNEPVPVPGSRTLSAAMLDAAASWDALVGRHTDADTAARLTSSRFFRAIADRFPAGQAYAVAEETARFVEEGSFETVIVDTPPIGGAVDFFDAPMHIRSLVAGRALRVLTGPRIPGSRIVFAATARPALRLADRVLGGPLLVDLADFLVDLRTTYDGIRDRSRAVQRLLDTSQRIVVATPHRGPTDVAADMLARHQISAIVLNRMLPASWADDEGTAGGAYRTNLRRWAAEARRQQECIGQLAATGTTLRQIPWVTPEPTSLDHLEELASIGLLDTLVS